MRGQEAEAEAETEAEVEAEVEVEVEATRGNATTSLCKQSGGAKMDT
jgi:hypothetical protein